jgi:hypothetical protein
MYRTHLARLEFDGDNVPERLVKHTTARTGNTTFAQPPYLHTTVASTPKMANLGVPIKLLHEVASLFFFYLFHEGNWGRDRRT